MAEPRWGAFALERYIVSKWSSHPETDIDLRRFSLVRQFVQLGHLGRLVSRPQSRATAAANNQLTHFPKPYLAKPELIGGAPPEPEWPDILSPLRTPSQRAMASPRAFGLNTFGVIWLRTCYTPGSDGPYAQLERRLATDVALGAMENVLSDRLLYNFGTGWRRIFDVLPERLLQISEEPSERWGEIVHEREDTIARMKRDLLVEVEEGVDDPEAYARVLRAKTEDFHLECMVGYLFVVDGVAIETGKVMVVFYDDRGRVVRCNRMLPELCAQLAGLEANGCLVDCEEFADGDIGPDYLPGGECGPPSTNKLQDLDA